MQTSARNQFAGAVKSIKNGAVNSEIIIELAGGKEIAAAITCESVADVWSLSFLAYPVENREAL